MEFSDVMRSNFRLYNLEFKDIVSVLRNLVFQRLNLWILRYCKTKVKLDKLVFNVY